MFPRPKPRREYVPLERLTFDPRLQMRDLPAGQTFDPEWVAELREAYRAGKRFGPLVAVDDKDAGAKWVIAGFHRGEVYRLEEVGSAGVDLIPGTFADAQFWALSENDDHGLRRRPGDMAKAVGLLLDNDALMKRVRLAAVGTGGLHDAIAAACGTTHGTVARVLAARGQHIRMGQIERATVVRPPEVPTPWETQAAAPVSAAALADLARQPGDVGRVAAELIRRRAGQDADPDEPEADDDDDDAAEDTDLQSGGDPPAAAMSPEEKAAEYLEIGLSLADGLAGALVGLAGGPWAKHLKAAGKRRMPPFGADGQKVATAIRGVLKAVEKKAAGVNCG